MEHVPSPPDRSFSRPSLTVWHWKTIGMFMTGARHEKLPVNHAAGTQKDMKKKCPATMSPMRLKVLSVANANRSGGESESEDAGEGEGREMHPRI